MKQTLSNILFSGVAAVVFTTVAAAQESTSHKWNFNMAGGYTVPTSSTASHLEGSGNLSVGGGYNFSSSLGMVGEFDYSALGLSSATLNSLDVSDGNAHIWSLTASPIVRFSLGHRLGAYAIGGGGLYQRKLEFTSPTTVSVFNPIFGTISAPADQLLGSLTSTVGGLDAGGGLTYSLREGGPKLYVEARYNHAFTPGRGTDYVPVTIGVRW